jgi:elongation factor G
MEKIEDGPLTGSYARDIVVYIYDGKMHPVDSNELSFKLASRHAFRAAFKNAGPKILEPIYDVEVIVPEEKMGDVMTDLQGRRAIIMGMDADGNYQKIKARVPLAEMNRYSTALSSITSGRAMYSLKFAEYAPVPGDVQTQLLKEYEEQQSEEE